MRKHRTEQNLCLSVKIIFGPMRVGGDHGETSTDTKTGRLEQVAASATAAPSS